MHKATGLLYVNLETVQIHVLVDRPIVDYARALLPSKINQTRHAPHITLVRQEKVARERWLTAGRWHGQEVPFTYDSRVVPGEVYWWLRVWSDELWDIRRALGLHELSWACRPPDGEECFHITIGNTKP